MLENKEELKSKIIYRASYRGSKEMDILMTSFVKSLIDKLDFSELKELDSLVNLDDQMLLDIKKNNFKGKKKLTKLINSLIFTVDLLIDNLDNKLADAWQYIQHLP